MVEKCSAWLASDGELFIDEQMAKNHEFTLALDAWVEARFPTGLADAGSAPSPQRSFDNLLGALKDDRTKMLAIYKLLNGGGGPVAPAAQPLDAAALAKVVDLQPHNGREQ